MCSSDLKQSPAEYDLLEKSGRFEPEDWGESDHGSSSQDPLIDDSFYRERPRTTWLSRSKLSLTLHLLVLMIYSTIFALALRSGRLKLSCAQEHLEICECSLRICSRDRGEAAYRWGSACH